MKDARIARPVAAFVGLLLIAGCGKTWKQFAYEGIDRDMIALIDELAAEKSVSNVQTVLAKPDDPGLPDGGIDLVFTSNTYHHIEDPTAYFANLRTDLTPNGRVAILDLRPGSGWFQRWFGHTSEAEKIRDEMKTAGYQLQGEQDLVEKQSFLVFALEPAPAG